MLKKALWETLKGFLGLIVFAKPSENSELIAKASSTHPRKLATVLPDSAFIDVPPLFETSLAFINSDKAWHIVPDIAPDVTQIRYALKASFYKPQE